MPLVGGVATTVALAALSAGTAFADADVTGSAYAVRVDATLLDALTIKVDPQPNVVYRNGKGGSKSVATLDTAVVKAGILNAASDLQGGKFASEASAAKVDVLNGLIKASLIQSQCRTDQDGVHASAQLVDAVAAGVQLKVDLPDQRITLADGAVEVRLNEQIKGADGSVTVNALHVIVAKAVQNIAKADVILSQSVCPSAASLGLPPVGSPTSTSKPVTSPTKSTPAGPTTTATRPSAPGSGEKLPNTGANVGWLIGGAVVLVAAGGGSLYWARRRSAANNG
jgi:LPXTG-motif cell wall-anchored protein